MTIQLPFLDILLIKKGKELNIDIYFKITDTKQYLNFHSCHPNHTKNEHTLQSNKKNLYNRFRRKVKGQTIIRIVSIIAEKGLPRVIYKKNGIETAIQIPRKDLLTVKIKTEEDILPYVSTYNPRNPEAYTIIKQHLPILYADQKMKDVLKNTKFIKCKRQPSNYKRILSKATFSSIASPRETNKVFKCNRPNCSLCQYLMVKNSMLTQQCLVTSKIYCM